MKPFLLLFVKKKILKSCALNMMVVLQKKWRFLNDSCTILVCFFCYAEKQCLPSVNKVRGGYFPFKFNSEAGFLFTAGKSVFFFYRVLPNNFDDDFSFTKTRKLLLKKRSEQ